MQEQANAGFGIYFRFKNRFKNPSKNESPTGTDSVTQTGAKECYYYSTI
jgi:hypothetical protein